MSMLRLGDQLQTTTLENTISSWSGIPHVRTRPSPAPGPPHPLRGPGCGEVARFAEAAPCFCASLPRAVVRPGSRRALADDASIEREAAA